MPPPCAPTALIFVADHASVLLDVKAEMMFEHATFRTRVNAGERGGMSGAPHDRDAGQPGEDAGPLPEPCPCLPVIFMQSASPVRRLVVRYCYRAKGNASPSKFCDKRMKS
jgi:hypothetical protein